MPDLTEPPLNRYIEHTLLRADATARDIEKLCTEAYICDQEGTLIGKVTIHSITEIENLSEGIDENPIVIPSSSNLNQARSIASDFVGESIPVTHEGKLVAALTEGDIFTQVLELEDKIRQHDSE